MKYSLETIRYIERNALFEKQGVLEFESDEYENFLDKIEEDVYSYSGDRDALLEKEGNNGNDIIASYFLLQYNPDEIPWIKKLNILYRICSEPDYYVIVKPEFYITNDFSEEECSSIKNNRYEIATIVLNIPKNEKLYLRSILRHELKHLFYFLKSKILLDKANKDIQFFESYHFKKKEITLIDYLKSYKEDGLTDFITNNVNDFIVYSLYYLNLNECRANLENIYSDFQMNLSDKRIYLESYVYSKRKELDFIRTYSETMSPIYFIYSLIQKIYKDLQKENISDIKITGLPDLRSIYGISSFNQFCKFAYKRIQDEIIVKSGKIYETLKSQ